MRRNWQDSDVELGKSEIGMNSLVTGNNTNN